MIMFFAYYKSIITQIEKQYKLSAATLGIIDTSNDWWVVIVIVIVTDIVVITDLVVVAVVVIVVVVAVIADIVVFVWVFGFVVFSFCF